VSGPPFPRPEAPLTDGVIALRDWRESDIPSIVRICQDPQISRFTRVPSPYTEDDAVLFVQRHAEQELGFAIVEADDDGELLGAIGLRDDGEQRGECGYWVGAEARGRGVAARALRLLTGWGVRELGLARIQLVTHVDNPASQKVATRAGFRREGVLRAYMLLKGQRHDAVLYGLVPEDVR
jgi:RimJ/RimL family protein N-acetyltransferase